MVRTVIVIPVYGKLTYLKKCVDSIRRNTEDYQIVAVDDVSPDDETFPWLKEQKDIDLVIHKKNCGFTKTVNDGIKYARKKYNPEFVVPMNTDVIVFKQWLASIIKFMDIHKEAQVVSPFSTSGYLVPDFPIEKRIYHFAFKQPYYPALTPKRLLRKIKPIKLGDYIVGWGVMLGYCFLVRTNVFDKIGYLDERLRMFWSDEEFKFRLMEHNLLLCFIVQSRIHHFNSRSVTDKSKVLDRDMIKDTAEIVRRYPYLKKVIKEEFIEGYAGRGFEV